MGVHRLRDLDRRGRLLAVLVGALLLVPVATSVGRALSVDWRPSNDDALIVLQARDVLSDDPPLVGQPSTAQEYVAGNTARHPGPIEFYLLALPVRVLGHTLGTLLTAAAIAGGAVLVAAWVAYRRGGPAVGLGAAVLLGLAMWSSGTAVLSDPISSNVGGYPLIAGAALAWALWCDDRRLWPLAVAVWSFTVQQHLAIFGLAGMVTAWGVAGAVATVLVHRREAGRVAASLRWGAAAVAVGLACWAPPILDQLVGSGNLRRMIAYSRHSDRPTLGLGAGLRAAGRAAAAPPLLLRRELAVDNQGGWDLTDPLGGDLAGVVVGIVVALGVAGVAAWTWRRSTGDVARRGAERLALVGTALVVAGGGAITAANVPASFEAPRINFYRWVWPVSIAVWGALAWTVGEALAARRAVTPGRTAAPRWAGVGVGVALLAVSVAATATRVEGGDRRRDEQVFWFERETEAAVAAAVPSDVPVRLEMIGASAFVAQGPALGAALIEDGYDVRVDPELASHWGERRAAPRSPDEALVQILSGAGSTPRGEGRLVAEGRLPREPGGVDNSWNEDTFAVWVRLPEN
ncbi:MAG TPA: hypothetical protein VFU19_00870 [Iamia sp.]|nr:hypothetical protein [Iamia sp.]